MNIRNLLYALVALNSSAFGCANDHDLLEPSTAVLVIDPTFTMSKTEGTPFVTVFGTFKNTTAHKVDNLVVEAKLTNASGKVIDILTQPVYGIVVPAGQEVAFRLQGPAAAPGSYSSVQARVASGESHPPPAPRPQKAETNVLFDVFVSWAPMLLLILVWVFLARKYSGKGSTQDRMASAVNEQNALLAKQLTAIETIAAAASTQHKHHEG